MAYRMSIADGFALNDLLRGYTDPVEFHTQKSDIAAQFDVPVNEVINRYLTLHGIVTGNPAGASDDGDTSASDQLLTDTDLANERRLLSLYGDRMLHTKERGWFWYNGKCWENDEARVTTAAKGTALSIYDDIVKQNDHGVQTVTLKWAQRSQSADRVKAMMYLAAASCNFLYTDFDTDQYLLNVENGTLNLRTGELQPHNPKNYIRSIIPITYDESAECPQWLDFLQRVMGGNQGMVDYLQRASGYTLTGVIPEQILFFLYGFGRNGKSVFLETQMALCGEYGMNCRVESLMTRRSDAIPNDIARLAGARFVAVNETAEGQRLNEPLIKDMTGGDTMSARFLRREYFDFQPNFKVWMRGNHKPQIRGADEGIWRRFHLIPFMEYITDDECDPDLKAKLLQELPGILAWAVRGCLAWQQDGLNPPVTVTDATKEYRSEMDVLGQFIEDRCVIHDSAKVSGSALYKDYQEWADYNGQPPINRTAFGLALTERGFRKVKKGVVIYHGIGLLDLRENLETASI